LLPIIGSTNSLINQTISFSLQSMPPLRDQIAAFLHLYPQIFHACHRRHVRDPQARRTLSLNQAAIIDHLDHVEPTNLRPLARHMGVTASTMSLNVDRLERAGYIRRQRDRRDARGIELRLTASGNRLKEQKKVLHPQLVGSLLKQVPEPDRTAALRALEILATAATQMITKL
jgi:DNA-binding MarR family transcriptional regulator